MTLCAWLLSACPQEEAEVLTSRLAAAAAQLEQARAEIGDVYGQWERDREELVEEIRWVGAVGEGLGSEV